MKITEEFLNNLLFTRKEDKNLIKELKKEINFPVEEQIKVIKFLLKCSPTELKKFYSYEEMPVSVLILISAIQRLLKNGQIDSLIRLQIMFDELSPDKKAIDVTEKSDQVTIYLPSKDSYSDDKVKNYQVFLSSLTEDNLQEIAQKVTQNESKK